MLYESRKKNGVIIDDPYSFALPRLKRFKKNEPYITLKVVTSYWVSRSLRAYSKHLNSGVGDKKYIRI